MSERSEVRGQGTGGAEGCCPGGKCAYRPGRVAFYRKFRGMMEVFAESPRTSLHQLEHGPESEETDHPCDEPSAIAPGTGGTSEDGWTEWLLIAADLDRAQAAGCRTTEETARFLCPWTVVVENIRDEGREARGES